MPEQLTVRGRPAALPEGWIEAYRRLRPALLGHVIEDGFVDERIRPIIPSLRPDAQPNGLLVGSAITVRLPDGDLEALVPAVDILEPGDVLVIDHGGRESVACWGELTSLAAVKRGCIGVIVDGAVANLAELQGHGLPTFARGVAALGGRQLRKGGGVNVPIQCGGVAVHPGDLVVADDDGVVIVPPARLDDVYAAAEAAVARLPLARAWVQHGGLLGEIGGLEAAEIQALLQQRGWT
jgi:4-hydroxy-4-methyl-2-oxoglutarate aldolase